MVLYKDGKYELTIGYNAKYLTIGEVQYKIFTPHYGPCTYMGYDNEKLSIVDEDFTVNITFGLLSDLLNIPEDWKWSTQLDSEEIFKLISPLEFCKLIDKNLLATQTT